MDTIYDSVVALRYIQIAIEACHECGLGAPACIHVVVFSVFLFDIKINISIFMCVKKRVVAEEQYQTSR